MDVHDPRRRTSFRLFDYEYSVALAFDGRSLAKVIPWVRLSTGLDLTAEQLTAFAERLDQLGFLEADQDRTPGVALEMTPAPPMRPADEAIQAPLPVPSQPVPAQTPGAVATELVTVATPVPVPSPTVDTPASVATEPIAVAAAPPVPLPTPTVAASVPVPETPTAGESEVPASPSAPPEEPSATESRPAPAEPVLAEAEMAATEEASADFAAEPSAAVVSASPDRSSQAEPMLPVGEATPTPVEASPAAGTPSPAPVLPETRPVEVPEQAPSPSPVPPETRPVEEPEQAPSPVPSPAKTLPPLPELRPQSRMSDGEAIDNTSRPYPVSGGTRMLTPGPRRLVTPPPVPTPPPLVTPAPARSAAVRSGPWILYAMLGILAALVVGVLVVPVVLGPHPPTAARARVLVASPGAVLRWFDSSAPVEAVPSQVLNFPAGGKVIRLASPGISLRPGDVVAATDAARGALADLARQQERLARFEKLAEGVRDTGDEKRSSAARAKLQVSAGLVEQAQAALSRVAVVAQAAGQVEATLAILGRTVQAGALALRVRPAGWRASFELPRALAARFRKQGWCGAEIEGRPVTCNLASDAGDETRVVIELAPEAATAPGQTVRLARARFAEAFLVPTSALARVGNADRVLLVAPTGRAEVRSVTVADRTAADAVITQGLDAGDAVIIETSQPVGAGARVRIVGAMHE